MSDWRRNIPNSAVVCRGPGCGLRMRDGMVFCTTHWNALPVELRNGIYAAKSKPEKYKGAVTAAIQWLNQRSQAIIGNQTTMPQYTTDEFIEKVACIAHETNRAYCLAIGDNSQMGWNDAPPWQRNSAIAGVRFTILHPKAGPAASHESWLAEKRADGWVYGPVKDAVKKEHPCFVPYDHLPAEQRAKDYIFQAVVRSVAATFRETP